MARIYRLPFQATSISTTVRDLWAITTGSSLTAMLEEVRLDPCATSVSELNISIALFTGSYTAGSGGSTLTPAKTDSADAAASFTCKTSNTTQTAVGTGTKVVLDAGSWNLANGWAWQPLAPLHKIVIPESAALVISLDSAGSSQTVSGCVIVSEGV